MNPAPAAMSSTYIGFTPRAQMAMAQTMGIQALRNVIFACFAMLKQGDAIRATTAGRMPLNVASTHGISRNCVRHVAMSRMTIGKHPRTGLCHSHQVHEHLLVEPAVFLHHVGLDEGYHSVASTDGEGSDTKECCKEVLIH